MHGNVKSAVTMKYKTTVTKFEMHTSHHPCVAQKMNAFGL
jgi:hypothetical protein